VLGQSFLDKREFQVLVTGGRVRADSISLVGLPESLPNVNLNVGFFGVRGWRKTLARPISIRTRW
jgi:DeoR/GlpR family transcriptional regulator of sugar metabolism